MKIQDTSKKIDIEDFGVFRMGLSSDDVRAYLRARAGRKQIPDLIRKFNKEFGCQTCPVADFKIKGKRQIVILMYRHDVEHVADFIFNGTPYLWD